MKTKFCVLLLVKYPKKGKVKVRLSHFIDNDIVVEIYKNFVLDIISLLCRSRFPFFILFHPKESHTNFRNWLGSELNYLPQRGNDLGERLKNGFMDVFSRGFKSAIAIASDIPDIPEYLLQMSYEALNSNDVVIGPSPDGGYYLIGFQRKTFVPEVFKGIAWSTNIVFLETRNILIKTGSKIKILPEWNDIDTFDDLKALIKGGISSNIKSSRTIQFLQQDERLSKLLLS